MTQTRTCVTLHNWCENVGSKQHIWRDIRATLLAWGGGGGGEPFQVDLQPRRDSSVEYLSTHQNLSGTQTLQEHCLMFTLIHSTVTVVHWKTHFTGWEKRACVVWRPLIVNAPFPCLSANTATVKHDSQTTNL